MILQSTHTQAYTSYVIRISITTPRNNNASTSSAPSSIRICFIMRYRRTPENSGVCHTHVWASSAKIRPNGRTQSGHQNSKMAGSPDGLLIKGRYHARHRRLVRPGGAVGKACGSAMRGLDSRFKSVNRFHCPTSL